MFIPFFPLGSALNSISGVSTAAKVIKNKLTTEYIHECSGAPNYGDVIFCRRMISLYKHFGIYIGDDEVIHFAPYKGDYGSDAIIHKTSLSNFADGDTVYRMIFPEKYNSGSFLRSFIMSDDYHLYTPTETVNRALSKLGQKGVDNDGYNIFTNNCEDFALWCKTGVSECRQLNSWIDALLP